MIATIQTPTQNSAITSSTVTSDTPTFEALLECGMTIQFRRACRYMRPEQREEATQEMVCLAYANYASLMEKGREDIFPSRLADFAICTYFDGRRFCGQSSTDISAPRCQKLARASVTNNMMNDSVCKRTFRPSTIACFNIDYEAWVDSLDARMREILFAILDGETTGELAKRFGVSFGRISQIRRILIDKWHEFTADRPDHDEEDA